MLIHCNISTCKQKAFLLVYDLSTIFLNEIVDREKSYGACVSRTLMIISQTNWKQKYALPVNKNIRIPWRARKKYIFKINKKRFKNKAVRAQHRRRCCTDELYTLLLIKTSNVWEEAECSEIF